MDDDSGPTASIIIFLIFIIIDMLFYSFGSAVKLLNAKEIERRAEEDGDKKSQKLNHIINHPNGFINTLQLIVTLCNIIIGVRYLNYWKLCIFSFLEDTVQMIMDTNTISSELLAVISTIVTFSILLYIILTFGILLPKKIAARMPVRWAYACVTPIYTVMKVLSPLTGVVTVSVNLILHLFGAYDKEDENDVTEEEIIDLVQEGHEQGLIQASEAEMISNIFEYGDKEAQDIMTHRNNIVAVDANMTFREVVDYILAESNSRYPVYEENIDHVIGVLYLKDVMRFYQKEEVDKDVLIRDLPNLLRDVYFVPKTKNIDELFQEMQSKKRQMAMVIDEYGQTDGLVTMEDILEEIVGNIMDEYDEDTEYIEDKGNNEYVVEGKMPLEDLEEELGISFEEESFETLNGFLISKMDRIPEENDQFEMDIQGYHFKLLSVENKMISSVLVTRLPEETVLKKAVLEE